jgi:apolipoprotein N-acyltransferase
LTTRASGYALAALSGVLLALSFPSFGHPACGWIALTPLIVGVVRVPTPRAFVLGLLTGIVYFTGTLYWITRVMVVYGGLSAWVAVLVNLALIAYLALFPAIFAAITRRLFAAFGPAALAAAPLVWVTTELARTYLLGGFPWVLLGYSQASVLPIAQLASLLGVYGVSALVAGVSAAFAAFALTRRPLPAAAAVAAVIVIGVWGAWRISRGELVARGEPIRVGLIQGNVEQGDKWDPAAAPAIYRSYLRMTREAIASGATLVLWPESSTPFRFEDDRAAAEEVRALARDAGVSILLGSEELDRGVPTRYYNSAFVVRPDGTTGGSYRKMHLVPFGEYVPLKSVFFFAAPLVEAVSDFSPGENAALLPVANHQVSTAICYEIVYPALVREFVSAGSELITTITNDAWFGRTSAPYQHFQQAALRAVENGRYLVRAANTGISGVVDPYGRVLAQSNLFETTALVSDARLLQVTTLYTRIGDAFAYAAAAATALLLVAARRRRYTVTF